MAYQLQITTVQGTQILPLDGIKNGNILADPSASYTLIDEQGNPVTEDLSLTRKGDNLALEVDGESVANIEEFYSVDGSQYVVDGSATSAESVVVNSSGLDASGNVIAEGVVWQAETSFLGLSTLQLVGAGLGSAVVVGAAVAFGSEEESKAEVVDVFSITSSSATTIDENSGAGESVYTVTSSDELATGEVTYSLSDDDISAGIFTIDALTGDVTLTIDPDYETTDEYSFTVIATDEAGTSVERGVTLEVNNLDEVAPTITSGSAASSTTLTSIDENSGANQVVYTVTSTDTGDISTGNTVYSLTGTDASLFTIDSSTGDVTLIADPDHETQSSYSFNVVATDQAGNVSTAQAVTLDVNDIDDAAPTITSGTTATAIDENSGANQVVYTVTSTDAGDISTGNTIYSLTGTDASLFTIDSSTGAVTLIADPDYETQSSYSFNVVATDEAGNDSEQTVTLGVNDVDETAPTITSSSTADVDENIGSGQIVYTVTSTDTSDTSTGDTAYSLTGTDASLFTIDSSTGAVTLIADPDHETKDSYSFTVVATDNAGNYSEQTVGLSVNDLDEVAPTITSGSTASSTTLASIDENSGANQVVYTVTSNDTGDISTGNTVYSLTGTDASLFTIDSSTGDVTLIADPDHETQSSYSFNVVATDQAGNASTAQAVTLDVNDIDDAAPTITSGITATAIDENSGANQVVYTVTSTDAGDISTGNTIYSLTGTDASLFTIDSSTGAVTLIADPDYETQSSYSFNVVATDEAGNDSEQTVTLGVNDVDETAPTNTFTDAAYDEISNTLTLTGTNMSTLLFGSEDGSTDIKDNFNWNNLQWDIGSDDTDNITFGPTDINSVYVTDDNTLSITLTDASATSLESLTGFDDLTEDNSIQITAGFSADTAGNLSTTDAYAGEAAINTSIVVFDLVNGESSSHSDRVFESGVSYSIYIVVSSDSVDLSNVSLWDGGNLGSDDYIYLVSDGELIGDNLHPVTDVTNAGGVVYKTSSGIAVEIVGSGYAQRRHSSSFREVNLWTSAPTLQAGTVSGNHILTALPAGIVTSQGLA